MLVCDVCGAECLDGDFENSAYMHEDTSEDECSIERQENIECLPVCSADCDSEQARQVCDRVAWTSKGALEMRT